MTLQNQHLLYTIWNGQQEVQRAIYKGQTDDVIREEKEEEMNREILNMLQSFDSKWLKRFDQLLQQQTELARGREESRLGSPHTSPTQLQMRKSQ